MRYSAADRRAIANGEFFTKAELAARPWLGRSIVQDAARNTRTGRVDPNTRPVSAEARRLAESPGVCGYCWEPPDERSQLNDQARHPECQEAWEAERKSREG